MAPKIAFKKAAKMDAVIFFFFSFHPILFVDFLINQPIELFETFTNVRYWANLVLPTFWVTWFACDVI